MTESQSIPPAPSPVGSVPATPPEAGSPLTKVLVGVILLVVIGGGLASWLFSHSGSAARQTAEQFVRDLNTGDVSAARGKCLDSVTTVELEKHAREMKDWGTINSMTMVARELSPGPATPAGTTAIEGDIDFANLRKAFSARMIKQGEAYKIQEYAFR